MNDLNIAANEGNLDFIIKFVEINGILNDQLYDVLNYASEYGHLNIIEYLNKTKKLNNKHLLQSLSNSDIFWDEIISIKYSGKDFVYDATVPNTKNFIGNGIVLHNTAASISVALSLALENKFSNYICH